MAMPRWMPRSPVANTSVRLSANSRNICTDHSPNPRTLSSLSVTASSDSASSISFVSEPELKLSARPEMYSAFRWDRPAVRSVGMSSVRISLGVGNVLVSLKRAMNLALMERAAALETCCAMMPLQSAWKGSTASSSTGVEDDDDGKTSQVCRAITSARFGLTVSRCATPGCRSSDGTTPEITVVVVVVVVVVGSLDASSADSSSSGVLDLAALFRFGGAFVLTTLERDLTAATTAVTGSFAFAFNLDVSVFESGAAAFEAFRRIEMRADARTWTAGRGFRAPIVSRGG
ncbi:hypothetical protein ABW21_db0206535 [Orbilia brochopaga]|nr:hypothetical protein ABW21_db0206535 [Drechslerella brochopaga]